jgi:hypothetical protein
LNNISSLSYKSKIWAKGEAAQEGRRTGLCSHAIFRHDREYANLDTPVIASSHPSLDGGSSGSEKNMPSTNILDILNEHGGSMTRSQLVSHLRGFSISRINRILENLETDGQIKISGNTVILIPTYKAHQVLQQGNINEDGSIEPTEHKQVPIPYDKMLFRVVDESNRLLEKIEVDEGVADLLGAIWKHRISTTKSCQGGNGEMAWIGFYSEDDLVRFNNLIGHISRSSGKKEWILNDKFEIFFPPEHIAMMIEELNNKPID